MKTDSEVEFVARKRNKKKAWCRTCGDWVGPGHGWLCKLHDGNWQCDCKADPPPAKRRERPPATKATRGPVHRCPHCGKDVDVQLTAFEGRS